MTTTRTVRRKATVTIEVDVVIDVTMEDDPGVHRTPNGDGCPPSSDVVGIETRYDLDSVRNAIKDAVDAWVEDDFEDDH